MVSVKDIAQEMHQIMKNLENGQKQFLQLLEIHYITGLILNLQDISILLNCFHLQQQIKIYEKASAHASDERVSDKITDRKMKVEIICTTDDPTDNLEHHLKLKGII